MRFTTIQNDTELNKISFDLQDLYGHSYVQDANIKMSDPFGTREERVKEWGKLQWILENKSLDAVLVSQFIKGDLLTSSYLLAPIRGFKGGRSNIKIALILDPEPPFSLTALSGVIDLINITYIDAHGCQQLQRVINKEVPSNLKNSIIFVDDKNEARKTLTLLMTKDKLNNKEIQVMDFDHVHNYISGCEYEQTLPSAIISDTIEDFGHRAYRVYTGLGLCVVLRSTPRLQNVKPILYSSRFFGDPNDPNPPQELRAFDEVFVKGNNLEDQLDNFLKKV